MVLSFLFLFFFILPSRSDLPLGDVSTSSLKGAAVAAQCGCSEYGKCECCVPSPRLNYTYIMWLKIVTGVTPLWSPLMAVKPIDISKYYIHFKRLFSRERDVFVEKECTGRTGRDLLVLSELFRMVPYTFLSCLTHVEALVQNHTQ